MRHAASVPAFHRGSRTEEKSRETTTSTSPSSVYRPGPYDEVLRPCERCHVRERRLDETVGRVAQEVPVQAGVSGGDAFRGVTHLGGVFSQVVGGVQVEVSDVPEPAWREVSTANDKKGQGLFFV